MKSLYIILFVITITGTSLLAEVSVRDYTFIGGDPKSKSLYAQQKYKFWGSKKYPKDKNFKARLIVIANNKTTCAFWLPGKIKDGKWITRLGMRAPSKANWHSNGFLKVISGKFDSDKVAAEIKDISHGESGSFTICWRDKGIEVETKIILLEDDDKLLISTKLLKHPDKIKSYIVFLRCYPSSYGDSWEAGLKLRQRGALTMNRDINVKQDVKKVIFSKKEMWCLFYDNYFDVEKNRGEGPCAFLYNTAKTSKVILTVSNYSCSAKLFYYANKQSDIVLWDFNKMTNKQAIEYMKSLTIASD